MSDRTLAEVTAVHVSYCRVDIGKNTKRIETIEGDIGEIKQCLSAGKREKNVRATIAEQSRRARAMWVGLGMLIVAAISAGINLIMGRH